jgi:hypothetical protein
MANEKSSGVSFLTILGLVVAVAALVANWLSVPGFPYRPFRSESAIASNNADTVLEPTTNQQTTSSSSRQPAKERTTRAKVPKQRSAQPTREAEPPAKTLEAEQPAAASPQSNATRDASENAHVRTANEARESTAADGYYRGTVVGCLQESNIPGAESTLCIDLGGKVVSAVIDRQLYVLIGGWRRRIPVYPNDVIRFEVRGGQIASAELLSDPHGR